MSRLLVLALAWAMLCLTSAADTVLEFPKDCSLGMVSVDPLADGPVGWIWVSTPDWHELGEARGTVSIPDGCRTMLKVGELDEQGLKLLRKTLKHMPLDRIQIGQNIDVTAMALPAMPDLKELMLGGDKQDTSDAGVVALKGLRNLEYLSLAGDKLTGAGIVKVAQCTSLRGLKIYAECPIVEDTFKQLTALKQLEELYLQAPVISNSGLAILAGMPALCKLDLTSQSLSSEGYTNLCKVRQLAELTVWYEFTATDAAALAAHPTLQRLSLVQLVDDATFTNICNCKPLRTLTLECGLNEGGLARLESGLMAIGKLENLEVFSLGYGRPPQELYEMLAGMKHLKELYMQDIPDEGLEKLAASSSLQELKFGGRGNSHQALMHLSRIKGLRKLRVMYIQPETISMLQEVLPDLEIKHRRKVYPPKNTTGQSQGHNL